MGDIPVDELATLAMFKPLLNGNAFERTFSTERWLNYPLECVTTRRVFLFGTMPLTVIPK